MFVFNILYSSMYHWRLSTRTSGYVRYTAFADDPLSSTSMKMLLSNTRVFHDDEGIIHVSDPGFYQNHVGLHYGFSKKSGNGWTHRSSMDFLIYMTSVNLRLHVSFEFIASGKLMDTTEHRHLQTVGWSEFHETQNFELRHHKSLFWTALDDSAACFSKCLEWDDLALSKLVRTCLGHQFSLHLTLVMSSNLSGVFWKMLAHTLSRTNSSRVSSIPLFCQKVCNLFIKACEDVSTEILPTNGHPFHNVPISLSFTFIHSFIVWPNSWSY